MKYRWIYVAGSLFFTSVFFIHLNLLTFILLIYWWGKILYLKHRWGFIWSLVVACIVGLRLTVMPRASAIPSETSEMQLVVKQTTVKIDGDSMRFEAYHPQYNESLMVQYRLTSEQEKLSYLEQAPETVMVKGELVEPEPNSNIHQFNYQSYLNRKQIFYQFKANELVTAGQVERKQLALIVDQWRYVIIQKLEKIFFGSSLGYIRALLFADLNAISLETMQLYKTLGIVHLMSISGLHIDLMIKLIKRLMNSLHISKERSAFISIIVLPCYMVIAGMGVSVFRAVISNVLGMLTQLLKIPCSKSDCWSLTLILAICLNPYVTFSIGFQLSYGLSGLLILIAETRLLERFKSLQQLLIVNVLTNLVSIPIITYHFFEFPLVAFVLNLIFIPIFSMLLFPLVVGTFFIGLLIQNFNIVQPFVSVVNQLILLSEQVLDLFLNFKILTTVPGRLNLFAYMILAVALIGVMIQLSAKKWRWLGVCSAVYLLVLSNQQLSPFGAIYMMDIGQGDAIVIKPPFSRGAVMIDTGGQFSFEKEPWQERDKPFSLAEQTIIPSLKALGITHIDELYVTHGDHDHIGELEALTQLFHVKEVRGTEATYQSELFQSLSISKRTKFSVVNSPTKLNLKQKELWALMPDDSARQSVEDSNNHSLVLYGKFGERNWLFTGDLEEQGEKDMIQNYPNLPIDILKVAHHGSQTSTTEPFINQYQPQVGLISVGENNRYQHPHQEVIKRLEESDVTVYRTDKNGGILYRYSHIKWLNRLFSKFITVK